MKESIGADDSSLYVVRFVQKMNVAIMALFHTNSPKFPGDDRHSRRCGAQFNPFGREGSVVCCCLDHHLEDFAFVPLSAVGTMPFCEKKRKKNLGGLGVLQTNKFSAQKR